MNNWSEESEVFNDSTDLTQQDVSDLTRPSDWVESSGDRLRRELTENIRRSEHSVQLLPHQHGMAAILRKGEAVNIDYATALRMLWED